MITRRIHGPFCEKSAVNIMNIYVNKTMIIIPVNYYTVLNTRYQFIKADTSSLNLMAGSDDISLILAWSTGHSVVVIHKRKWASGHKNEGWIYKIIYGVETPKQA